MCIAAVFQLALTSIRRIKPTFHTGCLTIRRMKILIAASLLNFNF
jgi:hypothetical protein